MAVCDQRIQARDLITQAADPRAREELWEEAHMLHRFRDPAEQN